MCITLKFVSGKVRFHYCVIHYPCVIYSNESQMCQRRNIKWITGINVYKQVFLYHISSTG